MSDLIVVSDEARAAAKRIHDDLLTCMANDAMAGWYAFVSVDDVLTLVTEVLS